MSGMSVRRAVAATGALAVAAGFAVTMGAGAASAAPETITVQDGANSITRTVSNVNPNEGETVTVTTQFAGTATPDTLNWFESYTPTCFTYKTGTAKVAGLTVPLQSTGAGVVRVAGSWPIDAAVANGSPTTEFQYVVGANCTREVVQTTGFKYGGGATSGTFDTKGPLVTVAKNVTTTQLNPVTVGKAGVPVKMTANVLGGRKGDLVKFFAGTTELGSGALDADNGFATYTWKPAISDAGPQALTAQFLATPFAAASTSPVQNVTVEPGDMTTSTTLILPPTALTGVDVALKAQVSPFPTGGDVTFKSGATVLGTAPVGADGTATVTVPFTLPGAKSITAVYSGVPGFTGSTSPAVTLTISDPNATDVATTTTLILPTVVQKGNAAFLVAQVAPNATGGTVRFYSGTEPIGNPVALVNGKANMTNIFTVDGVADIRAVYTGAPGFLPSEGTGTLTVADTLPPTSGGGSADMIGALLGGNGS
ncbi:Ig-like domain-containing protein [Rhodococcus sp. NPDC127528]|uniref:Ig-like domain-containing protein n=1 Tax=unclassified Rhodococcus (in: high G+C Gram-positive bacteria) TaxID=192944 RepID=UPI00363E5216